SFGDYYKEEAITWAWELLTKEWGLDANQLWATCFKDEKGEIPTDDEAADIWRAQDKFDPDHVMFFGRKDNFWEMAEVGPCGPCSEIHIDLGESFCNKKGEAGHVCHVNGDCKRFLEIWNLVFIQYNRLSPTQLEPLPAKHVDTGMGLDRVVAVIQNVYSTYRTDLLMPLMHKVQSLTGQTEQEMMENVTPYRVIADHGRAATFLIADGVVPGNIGRNYVCRMIIRRAARFGKMIGLTRPFLSEIAQTVIDNYGEAFPELLQNKNTILDNLNREETRFARTIEAGMGHLEELIANLKKLGKTLLPGSEAFNLYATHGLPFEITRDVLREQGLDVDEASFLQAMEGHRLASGANKAFGTMGADDVDVYRSIFENLKKDNLLPSDGVGYNPYDDLEVEGKVLAILIDGNPVTRATQGDFVEIILPKTGFYIESGGQVSDEGSIVGADGKGWEIKVMDMRRPAAGIITHIGEVVKGTPAVGDRATATVDSQRRKDIMRNHTATHLLHAALHNIIGKHARQAGSLVAPDRLRFDFTHPQALTPSEIKEIEEFVNRSILENYRLSIGLKPITEALEDGAMALFGEKYGEIVRTISIERQERLSLELCGGTHVDETGDIGIFIITSEGSAAAGIRRIEAITGRGAYRLIQQRFDAIARISDMLESTPDNLTGRVSDLLDDISHSKKQLSQYRQEIANLKFNQSLDEVVFIKGIAVLSLAVPNVDADALRGLIDRFRQKYNDGVVALGTIVDGKPMIVCGVTDTLVKAGIHAGDIARAVAQEIGGSGGGRPNLAQAGGKDAGRLQLALDKVIPFVKAKIGEND
ncbi:MAG: alanine--tRNA ligase, partial [Anaerolineae bacterium]|nr:alanine--tRNA ligase [Anaerolineae bacterium]